jgi:uncharacterized Zn finger protein (UPF0148 family)
LIAADDLEAGTGNCSLCGAQNVKVVEDEYGHSICVDCDVDTRTLRTKYDKAVPDAKSEMGARTTKDSVDSKMPESLKDEDKARQEAADRKAKGKEHFGSKKDVEEEKDFLRPGTQLHTKEPESIIETFRSAVEANHRASQYEQLHYSGVAVEASPTGKFFVYATAPMGRRKTLIKHVGKDCPKCGFPLLKTAHNHVYCAKCGYRPGHQKKNLEFVRTLAGLTKADFAVEAQRFGLDGEDAVWYVKQREAKRVVKKPRDGATEDANVQPPWGLGAGGDVGMKRLKLVKALAGMRKADDMDYEYEAQGAGLTGRDRIVYLNARKNGLSATDAFIQVKREREQGKSVEKAKQHDGAPCYNCNKTRYDWDSIDKTWRCMNCGMAEGAKTWDKSVEKGVDGLYGTCSRCARKGQVYKTVSGRALCKTCSSSRKGAIAKVSKRKLRKLVRRLSS